MDIARCGFEDNIKKSVGAPEILSMNRGWKGVPVNAETTTATGRAVNIYAETDLQMKAKALGLCAVKSTRSAKRWRDNPDLMAFLAQI